MSGVAQIVGRVAAELVREQLQPGSEGSAPKVVVSNLEMAEVIEMVARLRGHIVPGQTTPVEIVVATDETGNGIPDDVRLAPNRTLAWHRNNNVNGLVLIQLVETSDQQSLRQMFRLTDRALLERPGGDDRDRVVRLITSEAWKSGDHGELPDPPDALHLELVRVHAALSRREPVALRRWARFVEQVCASLTAGGGPVDAGEVQRSIGDGLVELGLFPHRTLFDEPARVERHLERNRFLAEGRNPGGKDVQDSYVLERIERIDHVAADGSPLSPAEQSLLRDLMRRFAEHVDAGARAQIDYVQYERLFGADARRTGLGTRVRREIEEAAPERLPEYEELEIEGALDDNDHSAAAALLDTTSEDGAPLADVLSAALRRRLEKVAVPPAAFEDDPLRAVLQHLVGTDELSAETVVRLEQDLAQGASGEGTLALFAFMWGPTLREVADDSAEGTGARLELDDSLTAIRWPEPREPEEGEATDDPWAPVPLCLRFGEEEAPRHRFRWGPPHQDGFAALAAIVRGYRAPTSGDSDEDLETWCRSLAQLMLEREPDSRPNESAGIVGRWIALRDEHFDEWRSGGLSADALEHYIERWEELLVEARAALVPANAPLPELDAFLSVDVARLGPDRAAITAAHPLRLRWFAEHLRRFRSYLQAALDGAFSLNPENQSIYFDWLRRVSPHRQPPLVATDADEVMAAIREYGLHEEYSEVNTGGASEAWIGAVDEGSVEELTATVASYLDAFPHKADGLGLLVLTESGDERLAERIIKGIGKRRDRAVVNLHVVAPRHAHRGVVERIGDVGGERDRDERLFPAIRLVVHEWPSDWSSLLDQLEGDIDLAIVPNLFGAQTRLLQKTRPAEAGIAGRFDPWLDPASHTTPVPGGSGENVSRVLLPSKPDPLLEAWSTLAVRRFQRSPVAPDASENTDYFTLQVTFDRRRDLFDRLHDVAHWVVTLDPFVGRDQIDALESPPDIILVRSGLGKNKTHTLVVSSRSGRDFVINGLRRRLDRNLRLVEADDAEAAATRLYEVGRNTVPGVMLRALGLGRGLEEIIGLVVTRYAVEERFPPPGDRPGLEWWLSLDDHLAWFGGTRPLRADLLRAVMSRGDSGELEMELQIIESKFRQREDLGTADDQLDRTKVLFEAALAPGSDETDGAKDVEFWRRELLTALDETSRRSIDPQDLPPLRQLGGRHERLRDEIRDAIESGEYRLTIKCIACALATEVDAPTEGDMTPHGHPLIKMARPEIARVLDRITRGVPPGAVSLTGAAPLPAAAPDSQEEVSEVEDPAPLVVDDLGSSESERAESVAPRQAERGLSRAALDLRYQHVLDAFHEFKVLVSRPATDHVDQGPAFYLVRVVPGPGVPADRVMGRSADLKLRLQLPAELNLRTYVDRGAVVFEVPKQDDERYDVDAITLWTRAQPAGDRLAVPVGEDIAGNAVSLDFSSSDTPHLLIAGTTGSGKSVALETILQGLCRQFGPEQLELRLVDPKGTELVDFESDPHLRGQIGMDAEDAIALLESAVEEMQRRYQLFKSERTRSLPEYNSVVDEGKRLPWWLVVLDEYADLTSDPQEKKDIEALLRRLAQKARAAGIHLIIATQRPSADVISSVVRSNLPAQLALRVRDATDSRVILGESGAEALAGRGDALLRTQKGLVRIQCARVTVEAP